MKRFDVVIIGAGAGGLTCAFTARGFGRTVALIDKNKPGGECTWSGCIPSKALINQANEVFIAKKYSDFSVDTSQVMENVRNVIGHVYAEETPEVLGRSGINYIEGKAKFLSSKMIEVNGERLEGKKVFITTGSSPMVPPIEGLDKVDFLTNESIFELEELPKSVIVLGAGAIGVELSQAMNRLGVSVSLVEMAETILPREDIELTKLLEERLKKEGVKVFTSQKAVKAYSDNNIITLQIEGDSGKVEVSGNKILLALGRVPNTQDLDLEKAGIKYGKAGIDVNEYLETTARGVYAVGDVTGKYMFSHMANAQGIKAVQNALFPFNRKMNYSDAVWCTFTSPELATVGLTEKEAKEKYGDSIRVYRHSYNQLDRAKTKPGSLGEVKLVLSKKGRVIGCSILGDRAGEIISEVQLAKSLGVNFGKLGAVIHPYPTYSEILSKIGKKVLVDNFLNMSIVRAFRK